VRILFDQGTPLPLRRFLTHHEVATAYERAWARFKNGELLDAAERGDFEVLVTTDLNLKFQQNLRFRHIGIVALSTPSWPRIQRVAARVVAAIEGATAGSYVEVDVP
jgi:hypothetical protein